MISHGLAFVAGFFACFAWLLFEAFYGQVHLRRKPRPKPEEPYMGTVQ